MKLLSDLPHNSKYCIIVEPLWALFGGMIFFYAPLYMKSIGLSEVEIGLINTVNLFIAFLCHLVAAPITNKLGRKKTSLIFDVLAWSIPMVMWAVAQNFWYFLIGYVINATVKVVYVSWFCLLTEDAEEGKRSKIFGIINLINYASGIFTPITGIFIAMFGTIPTLRVLYLLGAVGMTAMFFLRNYYVKETQAGKELMEKHSSLSILQSLKDYINTVSQLYKNSSYILIGLIYVITTFIVSMNFFQVIFFKDYLGFKESQISLIPGISALINALLYIFIVPKLNRFSEEKTLSGSLVLSAVGSLIFLFIPGNNVFILLVTTSILAIGNFITQTYRDTVFMNRLGEHEKADMFSAVQTLSTLICIPSGYIAGLTYSINPRLPFIMIFALNVLVFIISVSLAVHKRDISGSLYLKDSCQSLKE